MQEREKERKRERKKEREKERKKERKRERKNTKITDLVSTAIEITGTNSYSTQIKRNV